jgi:hypothetical protein
MLLTLAPDAAPVIPVAFGADHEYVVPEVALAGM